MADSPVNLWKFNSGDTCQIGNIDIIDYGSASTPMTAAVGNTPTVFTSGGPFNDGYIVLDGSGGSGPAVEVTSAPVAAGSFTDEMLLAVMGAGIQNTVYALYDHATAYESLNFNADGTLLINWTTFDPPAGTFTWPSDYGTYHHFVVTWDGTNQNFYFDGVLKAQTTNAPSARPSGQPFAVGASPNGTATLSSPGVRMSRMARYNSALSSARVSAHYNAFVGGQP